MSGTTSCLEIRVKLSATMCFPSFFSNAWMNAMTMRNIMGGFKVCGIFPFNRDAIRPPLQSQDWLISLSTVMLRSVLVMGSSPRETHSFSPAQVVPLLLKGATIIHPPHSDHVCHPTSTLVPLHVFVGQRLHIVILRTIVYYIITVALHVTTRIDMPSQGFTIPIILVTVPHTHVATIVLHHLAVALCLHDILKPSLLSIVTHLLFLGTILCNTVFVCWKLIVGHCQVYYTCPRGTRHHRLGLVVEY